MKKRGKTHIIPKPFFDQSGFFQFRPVTSDARKAVILPPLPPQLMNFFESVASSCSLDCCGIYALVLAPPTEWDKRDKWWNFNYDLFKLLQAEVEKAEALDAEVILVKAFQQPLYKDDWLFLLRYIIDNMEKSKPWK
ncbi:MAG: hypothetical protein EOP09_17465 [Proteobacteria bacterium]|nr:MAG: hypothetical protein EOP09_17465 [Pseudomonadota bacterium]